MTRTSSGRSLALLLLAPLGSSAPLAAQSVHVVDDDGGAPFATIQAAVDFAQPGDVVLVRAGDYAEFQLLGKGVSIVADAEAEVRVLGSVGSMTSEVGDLPAGQRALLRGLRFVPPSTMDDHVLRVRDADGVVWLEELVVEAPLPLPFSYSLTVAESMSIQSSAQVVLSACTVLGASGAPQGFGLEAGADALEVVESEVHAYGCEFAGGPTLVIGGTGQNGVNMQSGTLILRGGTLLGARGGDSGVFGSPGPGNGGAALWAAGGEVWSIGCSLVGGDGGGSPLGGGPFGDPGPPFQLAGGVVNEHAAQNALFHSTRVVRDDAQENDVVLSLAGPAQSSLFLLASFESEPTFVQAFPDVLATGLGALVVPVGSTSALGDFELAIGMPSLPPGLDSWNMSLQMALLTPTTGLEFSNPSLPLVVDESF